MGNTTVNINNTEYHIQSKINRGIQGDVYNAVNLKTDETIVLKKIYLRTPEKYKHFSIETEAILEIQPWNHPFLVNYFHFCKKDDYGLIAMEKCDCDLFDFISKRKHRILEEQGRSIFRKICIGLNTMHSCGIAHLDIKPENIMYDIEKNIPYIGNFGCCYNFQENRKCSSIRGTKLYSPPEYTKGKSFDPRKSDIYSLGVTLHILLTGCYPYNVIADVGKRKVILDSSLSDDCKHLLERMLRDNPKKRISLNEVMKHPWLTNIKKESKLHKVKQSITKHGRMLGVTN